MTSTPLDTTEVAPEVRDLDASAVLDAVVAARRRLRWRPRRQP